MNSFDTLLGANRRSQIERFVGSDNDKLTFWHLTFEKIGTEWLI